MTKIVVDAMGGDYAPHAIVKGAVEAIKEYDIQVILTGPKDIVEAELKKYKYDHSRISVVHASEVVEMHESPATTIRKKKDSSINVGINLMKQGNADAFFSAGNTGACVCSASLFLGMLPGIERPGISIITPTLKGFSLVIDVGANIEPKHLHLLQYAIMAEAYLEFVFNKKRPKIGILSIGTESSKGTDFIKECYQLLEKSGLNFIGNVEGKDIFSGNTDIIVCDGYVGNVALKVSESLAEMLFDFLRRELMSSWLTKMAVLFLKSSLRRFKQNLDYSEYGGAPLLGVNGAVIIGHGRSSAKAVKNGIRVAKEEFERSVNAHIVESIKKII